MTSKTLNDEELVRYSRQLLLPSWDAQGQLKVKNAHALVVGMGGLGSPVALYLAGAGVGHLTLMDADHVDTSNLHRQILYRHTDIDQNKAMAAQQTLQALNPNVCVTAITESFSYANDLHVNPLDHWAKLASKPFDLVVDCTDNFNTRDAINRACVAKRLPLVSGAAIGMSGQLSVFNTQLPDCPCYQCIFGSGDTRALRCNEAGVLGPAVGVIGSLQALETLKVLSSCGQPLTGRLLLFDGTEGLFRTCQIKRDLDCSVCGHRE